jgi:hypothetical protein
LITGGGDGWYRASTVTSAEIYDAETGAFRTAGRMTTSRSGHAATVLPDGSVLISGGIQYWPARTLATAEIYDPNG